MNIKPILFTSEMVRAILAGRKTQTRRVMKPQPVRFIKHREYHAVIDGKRIYCPYGQPSDRLWVRETWAKVFDEEWDWENQPLEAVPSHYEYRADLEPGNTDYPGEWPAEEARENEDAPRWKPSIFMPRDACRITLEIIGVRVERLHEISVDDTFAEGVGNSWQPESNQIATFTRLWDSINAKRGYSWESNPWVWVIEFRMAVE